MRTILASTVALSAISAFASGAAAKTDTAAKPGAPSKADRVEPEFTAVTTAVPMPTLTSARGSSTKYPFASLTAVGASFGVKNKTAAQMRQVVSNANRKSEQPVKDENGNVRFKMIDVKDPTTGAVIGQTPTTEAITERTLEFFAVDCDAKNDPDGASVRVFRRK